MTPVAAGPFTALIRAFEAAFRAGDASALAGMYTDNPVFMPPEAPNAMSTEDIRKSYQMLFENYTAEQSISVDESWMLGEFAFGRGGFTAAFTPRAGGEVLHVKGKWMNILAPQPDGSWKIARHICNSVTPLVLTGM